MRTPIYLDYSATTPVDPRVVDAMLPYLREQFGKHTVFLGSSYLAHRFAQHLGARGDTPARTGQLFKGETKRKRLAIPMFMEEMK